MMRLAWLAMIFMACPAMALAGPITVRPTPTSLVPVIEPLSYADVPNNARVNDQYLSQGVFFNHTALGTTQGKTAWMPTGEGWFRYPGADPDPFADQFNFYLGYRGVVNFDFMNPLTLAPDPVQSVKVTVFGIDPPELAVTSDWINSWWNPWGGVPGPDGTSVLEISAPGNLINSVSVYQLLKYPYPEVPRAWGVVEIEYTRAAAVNTVNTPEPSTIVLGVIGIGCYQLFRRRRAANKDTSSAMTARQVES